MLTNPDKVWQKLTKNKGTIERGPCWYIQLLLSKTKHKGGVGGDPPPVGVLDMYIFIYIYIQILDHIWPLRSHIQKSRPPILAIFWYFGPDSITKNWCWDQEPRFKLIKSSRRPVFRRFVDILIFWNFTFFMILENMQKTELDFLKTQLVEFIKSHCRLCLNVTIPLDLGIFGYHPWKLRSCNFLFVLRNLWFLAKI